MLGVVLSILLVIIVFLAFLYRITEQQRDYYTKWADGEEENCVGPKGDDTAVPAILFFQSKAAS